VNKYMTYLFILTVKIINNQVSAQNEHRPTISKQQSKGHCI